MPDICDVTYIHSYITASLSCRAGGAGFLTIQKGGAKRAPEITPDTSECTLEAFPEGSTTSSSSSSCDEDRLEESFGYQEKVQPPQQQRQWKERKLVSSGFGWSNKKAAAAITTAVAGKPVKKQVIDLTKTSSPTATTTTTNKKDLAPITTVAEAAGEFMPHRHVPGNDGMVLTQPPQYAHQYPAGQQPLRGGVILPPVSNATPAAGDSSISNNHNCRIVGQYELLETLGKGMSGKVKKAKHLITQEKVALKIIDKSKVTKRTMMQLNTEIIALKSLHHPNILQLISVEADALYPKKNGTQVPSYVLALQLAEGGELFDFMMYTGYFSEVVARTLFRQLLSALKFCHERGVYHRDIKPENLLLDDKYQLKIADFGLAAIRAHPDDYLKTECGTRSYMAPEILNHLEYDGVKADVWSMGVVLFILLAGNPPFQLARRGDWWFNAVSEGDYDRFWKAHKKYAPHFPQGAQNFLTSVFQPNPDARPNSEELMQHDWVQGPCLSNQALYREMSTRKIEVQREKDKEKEKIKAEKMRQVALMSGLTDSDNMTLGSPTDVTYDPFTRDRVRQRSVTDFKDILAKTALYETKEAKTAPFLEGGVSSLKGFTYFFSALHVDNLLDRLHWSVHSLSGTVKHQNNRSDIDKYRLRAAVTIACAKVKLDLRVWSVPVEDMHAITTPQEGYEESKGSAMDECLKVHVVEVTRKEGDLILFHQIFKKIQTMVQNDSLVNPADDDDDSCAPPAPACLIGGAEVEETMSDVVEMI